MQRPARLWPRRTLRQVLWTNEENGSAGAKAHGANRHVLAIEADSGTFRLTGETFRGPPGVPSGVHELRCCSLRSLRPRSITPEPAPTCVR